MIALQKDSLTLKDRNSMMVGETERKLLNTRKRISMKQCLVLFFICSFSRRDGAKL